MSGDSLVPFIKSGDRIDTRSFPTAHLRVIPDDIGLAASRIIELPAQERLRGTIREKHI